MRRSRLWTVLVIALASGLLVVAGAVAANAAKARPTAIAVVDVQKVFNNLDEKKQVEADLKTKQQQFLDQRTLKQKEMTQDRIDLEIMNPNSPDAAKRIEEVEKKVFEMQAWEAFAAKSLERETRLQITNMYNKVAATAGKVAKENGFDIVLFKDTVVDFTRVKNEDISEAIRGRKVLWAQDDLDLTEQVLQSLNNDFKNNVRPAVAPPSPTTKPAAKPK